MLPSSPITADVMIAIAKTTKSPFSRFEIVTGEVADGLLAHNHGNRPLSPSCVDFLASEMERDAWQPTHQGICIAETGRLLDGQHRLSAVIKSGKTINILVGYGYPETIYPVVDGHMVRKMADRLRLVDGGPVANMTVCRLVTAYLTNGVNRCSMRHAPELVAVAFGSMPAAFATVGEVWRTKKKDLMRSEIGAALVTYYSAFPEKAAEFMHQYATGEGLRVGDPAYTLREAAHAKRLGSVLDTYWSAISAMRAHCEGRQLSRLFLAAMDFRGNILKSVAEARKEKGLKGAATRKQREGDKTIQMPSLRDAHNDDNPGEAAVAATP